MLTFFTTAKPFVGHSAIIQRNALESWKLLHPDVEVILFGDDDGAAEVCSELGLRHEPHVERHESGTKQLDHIFRQANKIARHNYLCFSNCDIVLTEDFWKAFENARAWHERFLLIAQRWDIDVTTPIAFQEPGWGEKIRQLARTHGVRRNHYWIDFFLFPKGLYRDMPPLIVGHCYWDNWMIWKALNDHLPVIDASRAMVPVHQNHGYSPQYGRVKGVESDPLSQRNLELIGGSSNIRHIRSATYRLTRRGAVVVNTRLYTDPVVAFLTRIRLFGFYRMWLPARHFWLNATRR